MKDSQRMAMQFSDIWQFQTAKACLSALLRKAETYPQTITVHGRKKAVVMSYPMFIRISKTVVEAEKAKKAAEMVAELTAGLTSQNEQLVENNEISMEKGEGDSGQD